MIGTTNDILVYTIFFFFFVTDNGYPNHSAAAYLKWTRPFQLENKTGEGFSAQLMTLNDLEFRKAFLILNYIGE